MDEQEIAAFRERCRANLLERLVLRNALLMPMLTGSYPFKNLILR